MQQFNADWAVAGEVVRQELIKRGCYDPRAGNRSRMLTTLGFFGLVAAFSTFLFTGPNWHFWGFAWMGVFFIGAIAAFIGAYHVPETTPLGEQMAAPWRAYRAGLEMAAGQQNIDLDLDQATPYALALGAKRFLTRYLRKAEAQGYIPAWLGRLDKTQRKQPGFYRYWRAFEHDMRPPSRILGTSSRNGFRVTPRE